MRPIPKLELLSKIVQDTLTTQDMRSIVAALIEKAKGGDRQAALLLLQHYTYISESPHEDKAILEKYT